ncbi:MAG: endopeptidase La [Chloroflexota bacterium]
MPLRGGTVVFPLAVVPLLVGQERSIKLIDDVMRGDRMVAVVAQKPDTPEQGGPEDIHEIGTAGVIHQMMRSPDGTIRLVIQGVERIRIGQMTQTEPYLKAHVSVEPETISTGMETQALRRAVVDLYRRLVPLVDELPNELIGAVESLEDPRQLAYLVASTMPMSGPVRQELLEEDVLDAKLQKLVELLQHELAVRELGQKITTETRERMTKAQREYFLREQLRAIRRELGDEEEGGEPAQLRKRIEEAGLPEEARREADRELNRLANVPPASPEHGIIQTYLDWMASLPWSKLTGGEIDVPKARQILDEDHYDLEKIKDRILEYLAVKKLRQERLAEAAAAAADIASTETPAPNTQSETPTDRVAREPILCFVGPPGVGKTSLGQSIARALGRKFVRISLGGVHDEAEIRGHRRTYIGALPGRIIQAIRRAEARDPVFMLDEIDKVASDWRGDPSSALLEVLDPAQNHSFTDNYLGVGFDLSQVLFLTTANTLDTIPAPLRDRMEVLQLSGYTDAEKVQIATTYLVPKQLTAHGLRPEELTIQEDALRAVIRGYTREAGVRNLDREIASLCRKVAREIAEGHIEPKVLTGADVVRYLGRQRFIDEVAERTQRPGVATGLAWTPTGGDVLFVEATCMPSRNEQLILTGMLGDVMRESAQAALSYIRAYGTQVLAPAAGKNGQAGKNGSNGSRRASARNDMPTPPCADLDGSVFEGATIHLHVPAGAIPKDGPSAGVTMLTALASLATGRPVRSDLAMTGELTLRGKVLPIGGVKEKVLAAHRAGIKTILLPRQNERELEEDVPQDLRDSLKIVFVDTAEEVLENALEPAPRQDSGGPSKARGKTSARSKAATA